MIENFKESRDWNILKCRGWGDKPHSFVQSQLTYWDIDRQKWAHKWKDINLEGDEVDFFQSDNERKNGFFQILDCLDASSYQRGSEVYKDMDIVCDPYIDKYIPVIPGWTENSTDPMFSDNSFGKNYGVTKSNPRYNWVFQNLEIIYDGKPCFYIQFTNLCDLNKRKEDVKGWARWLAPYEISTDLEEWYIQLPPHNRARSLGELFRLIIDWDLAYHHFNNREPIAILCHKILGTINLPHEIYDEIKKTTPPSVVVRYLKNEPNPASLGDRPITPQSLIDWAKEKYWDLRYTSIDELHNVKEVDENHYCHR